MLEQSPLKDALRANIQKNITSQKIWVFGVEEMAKQDGIYKCGICGNVVSVIEAHDGELVCCGKPMKLLEEKTRKKEGNEKHIPILEIEGDTVKVKVGSIPHPMEPEHYIEFVQIIREGKVIAEKRLYPGQKPEAVFCLEDAYGLKAREFCSVHGLWKSD